MKISKNLKSSRLLKSFAISQGKLANIGGGTHIEYFPSAYTQPGNDACSEACPDSTKDWKVVQ